MPLSAITPEDEFILANRLTDDDRESEYYYCRACGGEMRLRIGEKRTTHFFHLHKGECAYGGESEDHLNAKQWIYDELMKHYDGVEMEKIIDCDGEIRIGDVVVPVSSSNMAKYGTVIEIQNSSISRDEIYKRMFDWRQRGYGVIWVITSKALKLSDKFGTGAFVIRFQEQRIAKWILNIDNICKNIYLHSNRRLFRLNLESVYHISEDQESGYYPKTIKQIVARLILKTFLTPCNNYYYPGFAGERCGW